MTPVDTGSKYDKIASWWDETMQSSTYGMNTFEKALSFHSSIRSSLDIGCGSGGRFINKLSEIGSSVLGVDVSEKMIEIAKQTHPNHTFLTADICDVIIDKHFDFIYAWDSIFHLPLDKHKIVIEKICRSLNPGGIMLYTFGNDEGEHTDTWMDDEFYYSSIGINENLSILIKEGVTILHLELDQYPEKHVVVIGQKKK